MTLVADDARLLYVRVPRTGSTSYVKEFMEQYPEAYELGHTHLTADESRELIPEKWDMYTSFGFVRNPWAWFVSRYMTGMGDVWPGGRIEPFDTPGIHFGQRMGMTFGEWLVRQVRTQRDWLLGVDWIFEMERFPLKYRLNGSGADYRDFYTDELAAWVAQKCVWECEFGYSY